jgi:hypothetical protein
MKHAITKRDRRIIFAIRALMAFSFVLFTLELTCMWASAAFGDTKDVFEFADIPKLAGPLSWWKITAGIALCAVALFSIGYLFRTVHRFLGRFLAERFFELETVRTIRGIAIGLIGTWAGIALLDTFLGPLLTIGYPPEKDAGFTLSLIGAETIFLIIGVTLYAVAKLLDRAREIDSEMKEIV